MIIDLHCLRSPKWSNPSLLRGDENIQLRLEPTLKCTRSDTCEIDLSKKGGVLKELCRQRGLLVTLCVGS